MNSPRLPPAILIMGPTASGKTAVAMALADRFPVELISVDSAQVFRDMDVGTAKPDRATLARYPHHLIDIISPEESYSAARFRADALAAMDEITKAGKVPVLVGGTMLYFRALLHGLADLPQADAVLRAEIDAEAAAEGWPAMHAKLALLDPATAARLHTTDSQRLQRALEICRLTGRPMSELLAESEKQKPPYDFLPIALLPSDRAKLHQRIARRFDEMLLAGLDDEVRMLRQKYALSLNLPSMRCVGYRQTWEAQDGTLPRSELRDRGIFATRQLAKRQITWLSNSFESENFDCLDPALTENICARTASFLSA
ncbi:MAG: tRNA (adenosine(37)-N6)-dimethylallyltransferase MiaA [Gammaproteobacteria bacterium]|nr:tRNA (adenosine(37)-N6)-dimethylallyltransferase MiaA [Gammaproteobacteria bacterium]MBU1601395.1 tRNA (adenosine(37)-N6)-dimethylallyltransferase MiaA [Gammaproteobacteria bacterium]MBU2433590.1 tRNA (adenosine(37)-N6)-dimethylallyltransferase MiaA [Gammaproteobacteria bacterium]MBU2449873.1 tRNA (adenosine(37)-N6)-dimethylallyltransferase MiaA [Gammaproteobacteria bacterium]